MRQKLKRSPLYLVRILATSLGYLSYFVAIVIFLCLGLPLLLVLSFYPGFMKKAMYGILKTYTFFLTRIWLPFLGVYSIAEVSGYDKAKMRNSIFIANHRGKLDALLLLSILPETGVLIKPKYSRLPIYSTFVKYLDFVRADSDSIKGVSIALDRCRQVLALGKNLLVFPEGTRGKKGGLMDFKDFAFKIALETARPIVPVIIHTDLPFMARTKGSLYPKFRFNYTVRFLTPSNALPQERSSQFACRVHDQMKAVLEELDKNTYWDQKSDRFPPSATERL